jgi:hypothetical protein
MLDAASEDQAAGTAMNDVVWQPPPQPPRPRKKHKKHRVGKRNHLTVDLTPPEGVEWGPAMKALPSDKHRAFVLALYQVPPGHGSQVRAAKIAGFGTTTSNAASWSAMASRLAHDDKILAALHEEDQKRIRASAPRAIRALSSLIEDPTHKDHARGIGMVLDRVHPTEQRHVVDVNVRVDHDAEAIAQLRMLKSLEVTREKLVEVFGFSGLSRYEKMLELADGRKGPVIEGTAVEIKRTRAND